MPPEAASREDLNRVHHRIDELDTQLKDSARAHDDEIRAVRLELHNHIVDGVKERAELKESMNAFRMEIKDFLIKMSPFIEKTKEDHGEKKALWLHAKKWGIVTVGGAILLMVWGGVQKEQEDRLGKSFEQRLDASDSVNSRNYK